MLPRCFVGGGGRSAVQLVKGTDVITAAGGGGAADCFNTTDCGGGGTKGVCIMCNTAYLLYTNETNTLLTMYLWCWALPHTGGGGNVGLRCSDVACGLPGTGEEINLTFHQTSCLVFLFQFLDCFLRILKYSGWLTHCYVMFRI